jgi:hypothetical protein
MNYQRMKKNNNLITVLYILARFSYRIILLFIIFALFFELFTANGEIGTFSAGAHHSKGYSVKAKVNFAIPDTLIIYQSENSKSAGTVTKTENLKWNQDFNIIKNNEQLNKTYQINNFRIYNKELKSVNNEVESIKIAEGGSEINIILNPKNIYFKSVLLIKSYAILLLLLFVCYQLMKLFEQLRRSFIFDILLINKIRSVGYSLIITQIITIIVSIITYHNISKIYYYHYIPSVDQSKFRFMDLEPIIEYDVEQLFLGLSLLVLAKLISYGFTIQTENDLTV